MEAVRKEAEAFPYMRLSPWSQLMAGSLKAATIPKNLNYSIMNLVLNTFGATLQKENGLFIIATQNGKQTFPPDTFKTITVSKAARITSDAIMLAIRHQVDVLFVNDMGLLEGRVW